MPPLVSVLIPVYNRYELIRPCIQSVLDQTVTDLEVIIVDNASTDRTWEVCLEVASLDQRVRVFRNETNVGPVCNWQRCLSMARGTYAKFLYSDDLIMENFLEETIPYIKSENVGFVFTMAEIGSHPGKGWLAYGLDTYSRILPSNLFVDEALFGQNVPVSPGAGLFRLSDLRKNLLVSIPSPTLDISKFPEYGAGIDLLVYLNTSRTYSHFAFVAKPLVFFRAHKGSITIANSWLRQYYIQAKIWFAKEYRSTSVLQRCLAFYWLRECKSKRQYISPKVYASRFVSDGSIGPAAMAWVVPMWFNRRLRKRKW